MEQLVNASLHSWPAATAAACVAVLAIPAMPGRTWAVLAMLAIAAYEAADAASGTAAPPPPSIGIAIIGAIPTVLIARPLWRFDRSAAAVALVVTILVGLAMPTTLRTGVVLLSGPSRALGDLMCMDEDLRREQKTLRDRVAALEKERDALRAAAAARGRTAIVGQPMPPLPIVDVDGIPLRTPPSRIR